MANSGPVILYGVSIHEAIASGDIERMKKAREAASAYLEEVGDLGAALEVLKSHLAKAGRAIKSSETAQVGTVLLYGVVIHQAIQSGDVDKMEHLLKEGEAQLKESGDVAAALEVLKAEMAKMH